MGRSDEANDEKAKTLAFAGTCLFCGESFAKRSMTRHVARCAKRPAGNARVAHLIIESARWKDFYLHVECDPRATLQALDGLLRDTWLECCGHLSQFTIGGQRYQSGSGSMFDWDMEPTRPLSTRIEDALAPKGRFSYEYDFGSTTGLVGLWHGWVEDAKPARTPRIVARNRLPHVPCSRCGAAAIQICMFCDDGPLCGECLVAHEADCEEGGLLPVVNSPRMGVCSYGG